MIKWYNYPEFKPKKYGEYPVKFDTATSPKDKPETGYILWDDDEDEFDLESFAEWWGYRYIKPIAFGIEWYPLILKDASGEVVYSENFRSESARKRFIAGFKCAVMLDDLKSLSWDLGDENNEKTTHPWVSLN